MTQWYCYVDDRQHGPMEEAALRQWVQSGRLKPDDLVWKEGMDDWVTATVAGLSDDRSVQGAGEQQPPPAAADDPITALQNAQQTRRPAQVQYGQQTYYTSPQYGYGPAQPPGYYPSGYYPTDPGRTLQGWGLGLAIAGVCCCPAAIVGIVLGAVGMNKSRAVGAPTGMGVAAIIIGSIMTLLNLVWTVVQLTLDGM